MDIVMANSKRGDRYSRSCKSTQTTIDQNLRTCNCYLKKRYEKSSQMVAPAENETIIYKPTPAVSKKTCTRCHSRRQSTAYELEPYTESTIQFYESYNEIKSTASRVLLPSSSSRFEHPPRKVSKNDHNLTPKEIMNTWIPGKERSAKPLLTPSDNYVDVSPRDFSLRKYLPELFLSETEKTELRDKERENLQDIRPRQQEEFKESKCPQGSCNSKDIKDLKLDQDWRNVVDDLAIEVIRTPCPWRDVDMPLAREREVVANEESNVKIQTPPQRPSKWFKWPCSRTKRGKKSVKEKQNEP